MPETAEAVKFLHTLAHALSTMALYPTGHAARHRSLEAAHLALQDLLAQDPHPVYSFLENEVIYRHEPMRAMREWEWSDRLARIGVQRLEFVVDVPISVHELEVFLDDTLRRLTMQPVDSAEAQQMKESGIKYGVIGVGGEALAPDGELITATIALSLGDEAETIRWLQDQVKEGRKLPLGEAEAVVRSLSVAMHGDRQMLVPLLQLRQFDEYTTTHSLNVCVLTMALAEWMGLGARDVRGFGVAGLLHDLGKVKIPLEVLNKKGKLDDAERELINTHPAEGARIILATEEQLDLAAVVAYEHHVMINGGGYPRFDYPRECHYGSRLVHVCDVYDALRTKRPYRDAWPAEKVLSYVEERSGTEFDGHIAHAFTQMMRTWEPQVARVAEHDVIEAVTPPAPAPADPAPAQPQEAP